jgi:competence protein ComFC
MHCLWCHEEIIPSVTWVNFLNVFEKRNEICETCSDALPIIKGCTCPKCSRPSANNDICVDCLSWERKGNALHQNISVFSYTPYMQDIMNKWKYRGDYVLVNMFGEHIREKFLTTFPKKDITLIPIPLSDERFQERGFNQAEAIARLLDLPIKQPLHRLHNEKQAKKSRKERLQAENPFALSGTVGGHVIVIDDLYTTGATLHWASALLKQAGASKVDSFTLIRS